MQQEPRHGDEEERAGEVVDVLGVGCERAVLDHQGRRPTREHYACTYLWRKLAKKLKLPLVIHCRNGWNEIFDLLSTVNRQQITNRGVFHSFTGNWTAAKKALDLGFYISFSGIVTFNNAKKIQDVAKKTPLERIIIETDSPFLSPEPIRSMRGSTSLKLRGLNKINEPQNVKIVAKFIADLRRLPFKKIADATFNNSQKLFGLE